MKDPKAKFVKELNEIERKVLENPYVYSKKEEQAFTSEARAGLLRLAGFSSSSIQRSTPSFHRKAVLESGESTTHYRLSYDRKFPRQPLHFVVHEVNFELDHSVSTRHDLALSAFSGSRFKYIHTTTINILDDNDARSFASMNQAGLPSTDDKDELNSFTPTEISRIFPTKYDSRSNRAEDLAHASIGLLPMIVNLDSRLFEEV